MTIASLAMYPFTQLRSDWNHLWDNVRSTLPFPAPALDWELDADEACRRDDLLLGQTCGWPLITDLATRVRVVGTFDCTVDGASDGTYRSVMVSRTNEPLADILHRPELRVVANSKDSLSGWISLLSVAGAHGVQLDAVEFTGAHAVSVEVLRRGDADLAAIDGVTWTHLDQSGLSVVGHGPRIPCLPLVTSGSSPIEVVDELRRSLALAVSDPTLAGACASLRIRGFLPRQLADYEGLSALTQLG